MPVRFSVLASGSSGNASLLEVDGFRLLIDCGLGPRVLGWRLAAVGASWRAVNAVVLTHTHGDHWNRLALEHVGRLGVPLVAHGRHHEAVARWCDTHAAFERAGLVRRFDDGVPFAVGPGLTCRPLRVPHDSDPTFAFRFDVAAGPDRPAAAIGYASDVGHVTPALADLFAGVDLLAVEFNHDEGMQRASNRPWRLIERVLGADGHLSNRQAADLAGHVLRGDGGDRLRYLVQLHLSRECNRPDLACHAGRAILAKCGSSAEVVTATQDVPTRMLDLTADPRPMPPFPTPSRAGRLQPALPGLD